MPTVYQIYFGSDGAETRNLYKRLEAIGPVGLVALNLFRAQKCSSRAKVYHGGTGNRSYRDLAYDRKQYSIQELCKVLDQHAKDIGIKWGWGVDDKQAFHKYVLYCDVPNYGQVSFHTNVKGIGPDYDGQWDGRNASEQRILKWVDSVLNKASSEVKINA
jgi:hypothetical protein